MATKLTERVVKALAAPANRPTITWDSELGGFGVRVITKGVKAFVLDYRAGGRQRRLTVGRYPEFRACPLVQKYQPAQLRRSWRWRRRDYRPRPMPPR